MLPPLIRRNRSKAEARAKERGFTMALVALSLTVIISMAALSIDIGTLYQAKAEAQRAADTAALAAARVISLSGITGDPTNGNSDGSWASICGGSNSPATLTAISIAQQNLIAGVSVQSSAITVTYGSGSGGGADKDCSALGAEFGINPVVNVTVQRTNLPIFFAQVFSLIPGVNYSGTSASATATAEVFNPSNSGAYSSTGEVVPVQPRCVKPWILDNADPGNNGKEFVHKRSGAIYNPGIIGVSGAGVIGETFNLSSACTPGHSTTCNFLPGSNPPGTGQYVPALVSGNPGAVPSCSLTTGYQPAIAGCDQTTVYACGVAGGTVATLNENPVNPLASTGDTSVATQCLINQSAGGAGTPQDSLAPGTWPFQIQAGSSNALVQAGLVNTGATITSSNSVATIPIANFNGQLLTGSTPAVTVVGFLQVFINSVDTGTGNLNVTVMNVSGCGQDVSNSTQPLYGSSPVPVRLISAP